MSHLTRSELSNKILIQLIEADVEIGFGLVDEAKAYRASGQHDFSLRAIHDAEDIVADIEQRVGGLGHSESAPFGPLVTELRNEIKSVERKAF